MIYHGSPESGKCPVCGGMTVDGVCGTDHTRRVSAEEFLTSPDWSSEEGQEPPVEEFCGTCNIGRQGHCKLEELCHYRKEEQ